MFVKFPLFLIFLISMPRIFGEDSNILQKVISNDVIFFDRKNYVYFVLNENCTEDTYKILLNGYLSLEQQVQKSFTGDDYDIEINFGNQFIANFTKSDNFYDTYANLWCLEEDKCFESSRMKNVENVVDQFVPVTKPCPTMQYKEFIVVISDLCIQSINKKLDDFMQCSLHYRNLILMLPTMNDVNKCAALLNVSNSTLQFFSSDLSSTEIEKYSNMKAKYQSTMEHSKMNLFVMLKEYWKNAYDGFNLEFKNIPLCKIGSISGYFQYITANLTFQRTATLTAPLNFKRDSYISTNYKSLMKTAEDNEFNCSFIKTFLTTANSMPFNGSQYNILIIEDPYLPCLKFDLLWNNSNRHLEIVVLHTGRLESDYSNFIAFSNTKLNHVNFYNRNVDGLFEFWKDTTVCRSNVPATNFTQKATAIRTTTPTNMQENGKNEIKWWIIAGPILLIIVVIVVVAVILRFIYVKQKSAKRKSFIREKADSIISITNIPQNAKYWKLLLDDKDVIIDYENVLGKGSKAIVHPAILMKANPFRTVSTIKVAAKIPTNFNTNHDSVNELHFLFALRNHSHIILLHGWTLLNNVPVIITELAENNLLNFVKNAKFTDTFVKNCIQFLYQISGALAYIAENKMIHRDVACRNILLTGPNIAKLADFGLCCKCSKNGIFQDSMQNQKFPIKWLSIEALNHGIFSEKSDVWSFGILCWEVFSFGQIPYGLMTKPEMKQFLEAGNRLPKPVNISNYVFDLMANCWTIKINHRLTFKEIHDNLELILENGYLSLQK